MPTPAGRWWTDVTLARRTLKGTIPSATVLQLFSTPLTLIEDRPGITLIPRFLYVQKPAGTAYTLNGSADLRMNYGASGLSCFQMTAAGTFDQAAEKKSMWFGPSGGVMNIGLGGANTISGFGLRFQVPTANWTLGTSDLNWKLWFYELNELGI